MTPSLLNLPEGCPFQSRCPHVSAGCALEPPEIRTADGRLVRCVRPLTGQTTGQTSDGTAA